VEAKDSAPGAPWPSSGEPPIRAAEVVGALSLATDLGTGQPLEHAMRTAVLAVRLGELAGASAQELVDAYYVALLHSSGCTSDGHEAAQLYGDDIVPRAAFALVDSGSPDEVLAFLRSNVGLGRPPELRAAMVEEAIAHGLPAARQTLAMHCEVAQRFAGWLGFSSGTQAALEHVFERWDGLGFPGVARGDEIPLPMRLVHVARDISVFLTAAGPQAARDVVEHRSGAAYEPRLADLAARNLADILAELDETRMWEQALEIEPFPKIRIAGERVDTAFAAIAAFTDLKSPWLREHSRGVAELAEAAAWRMDLPAASVTLVRRAALAHDLGRVGVSNAIWEKTGALGFGE
jgi:HD-GYP domain-containing protein (c-di-GMP phosphodiesterase class II)